ncbi:response regulator transcription factor [Paenibacillus agricola]|uniref:Response regulator transcription factor n=1 Tax=Paenibacillus agricola TaxID=2716264 RepID=A0ABX0J4G0_9BACL|nr:response regulator transcription factor [Paenibacillus agricola]NHN30863.1 response regulator transcription factor [Paenibacillus agricola]
MKQILIIEDELSIAELERDYLEIDGFKVDMESRGDTGLQRALEHPYDLIILDVMLPKVDGFEICRRIRSVQDTPILMVSAKKEDIDKIRGLGLGADDYIIKPFSPSELVARVKAHLNRYERLMGRRDAGNEEVRIRGLVIDKTSRRVTVNGQEVLFTTKEFDLLTYLAANPNRVFSKEQLFEQLWGMDSMGDIATVTVHIRKVREKVELDPSKPQYIETVWGAGYRFKL